MQNVNNGNQKNNNIFHYNNDNDDNDDRYESNDIGENSYSYLIQENIGTR